MSKLCSETLGSSNPTEGSLDKSASTHTMYVESFCFQKNNNVREKEKARASPHLYSKLLFEVLKFLLKR